MTTSRNKDTNILYNNKSSRVCVTMAKVPYPDYTTPNEQGYTSTNRGHD